MKNLTRVLVLLSTMIPLTSFAQDQCVANVDKLQLFYVNGMFTTPEDVRSNRDALDRFQDKHLGQYEKYRNVQVGYNFNETFIDQIAEVAFHKMTDVQKSSNEGRLLQNFILGHNLNIINDLSGAFSWFFTEIVEDVESMQDEGDYQNLKHLLNLSMDDCTRVLLVTHSQGNFYGNRLFTEISNAYIYPTGVKLSDYPMLGYLGIANPTLHVGGYYGDSNSHIAKTFTNDNDWPMWAIRRSFGAVSADPVSASDSDESYGHGLEEAYLENNAAPVLVNYMVQIIENLTPYPLFEQLQSSSSAFSHFGYSNISEYLDFRFRYGGGYRYSGVPEPVWNDLLISSSHGSYFNIHIRDKYPFEKIED
ncbi:KTSC domain-containing protein [Vibrio diazotrophicus]|uniref:KTSC domain-containing protein n=1 Tax=Vibrio diazotrophicus TaxID=685 RepID=UPI000C9DDA96|nr:KTSC domain-containing protein [Vibrio diazotrophicus]PNH83376.1 KTSC domain-containing protein [Vibrio diazotrophicus]